MADLRHLPSRRGRYFFRLNLALAAASLAGCGADPPPAVDEPCTSGEIWTLAPGFSASGMATAPAPADQAKAAGDGEGCGAYTFAVEGGQLLALDIVQLGVDLVVEVWEQGGEQILKIDRPRGENGIEPVVLAPARRTEYLLRARPWETTGTAGRFEVRVVAARPATAADRAAAEAWQEWSAADLRRERSQAPAVIASSYEQAMRLFRQAGQPHLAAEAGISLGSFLVTIDRKAAVAAFDAAVAASEEAKDLPLLARSLNELGSVASDLSQHAKARAAQERALEIYRRIGNRADIGKALSDLALVLQRQKQFHLALDRYAEALALWQELGMSNMEAITRTNLGKLYMNVGDRRQAHSHFHRALQLGGPEPSATRAWTMVSLSDALLHLEGPDAALPLLRDALEILVAEQNLIGEALALNSIGLAQKKAQRPREALEALGQSLAIYRAEGRRREGCPVAANLAEAFEDLGQAARAREEFLEALACARAEELGPTEVDALSGLGRVERRLGDRSSALARFSEALSLLETQRLQPRQLDQRSKFLEVRLRVYKTMVDLLIESAEAEGRSGDGLARAFEIAERSRPRALPDSLRHGRDAAQDPEIAAQLTAISDEINGLHSQRIDSRTAAPQLETTAYDEALALAVGRYQQEESRLFHLDTEPATIPTLETVHRLLEPGTLLLSYYLTDHRSFVWSVSHEGIFLRELPPQATLEALADDLLGRLGRQTDPLQSKALDLALGEASRQLLGPVAGELERSKRLMVIPSGALQNLPFAALPDPSRPELPLIAGREILYLPSAADLAELRRAPARKTNGGIAVLADPVVGIADDRWQDRAPSAGGIARSRLEFSAGEAERILAAAGDVPTLAASGFEANRDLLLSGRLADYRWLHIAGHGFGDETWPELSSLLLSAYFPNGQPRDGYLRSYEIRRLHFSADLVTLSACETASARAPGAEGLLGLSRGFFDAGARSVLMSLWPVHDAATSELMARFYRHLLGEGESPARALQLAQRSMAEDTRWSEPFFWAAFVLYGDSDGSREATGEGPLFTTTR